MMLEQCFIESLFQVLSYAISSLGSRFSYQCSVKYSAFGCLLLSATVKSKHFGPFLENPKHHLSSSSKPLVKYLSLITYLSNSVSIPAVDFL